MPAHEVEISEIEILMEVDRLEVKQFALDQLQSKIPLSTFKSRRKLKAKATLTDYVVDFGDGIMGTISSHTCQIANAGWSCSSGIMKNLPNFFE